MRMALRTRLGRQSDDVWGLVLLVFSALLVLAFFGLAGPVGRGVSNGLRFVFGIWAYLVAPTMGLVGALLLGSMPKRDHTRIATGVAVLYLGSLALFHLFTGTVSLSESFDLVLERGGVVGSLVAFPLRRLLGFWGALLVLFTITGAGALIVTRASVRDVGRSIWSWLRAGGRFLARARPVEIHADDVAVAAPQQPVMRVVEKSKPKKTRPEVSESKVNKTRPKQTPRPVGGGRSIDGYTLPPGSLLVRSEPGVQNRKALEQMAGELEETLHQHGVDARLTRIVPGPTVTRFEIELAPGVKVSRVTGMSHDIAYSLASPDVRILAPIPGKSAIGIEVPNRKRELVTIGDVLGSPEAVADGDPMKIALGKDINGEARMLKLDELPHLLIAGATGAGKSSCINTLVTSILMRATPDEVRLILVDPKRVELGQYNDVPHLLTRVITNPKKAAEALQWAVAEMDRRYELLADAGVRDITSYRDKHDLGGLDTEKFDRFPYIVVVVDELNDLMMVAGRLVEDSVVRIAQMARAVGLHLVLATQRPSVNVITGVIKANVPSRLAFSVTSQTDSRVILDAVGAEKLIGLGDMLVVTAREPRPERIQGAFVSEAEVHAVVRWTREQRDARYEDRSVFEVPEKKAEMTEKFDGEDPEIVNAAIELVVRSQLGSTSMLQRKLRIGFARAGRVMDILEMRGIVGPSEGSKAREVLTQPDELDQILAPAGG